MKVAAVHYDGKSSARRDVLITGEPPEAIHVAGEGIDTRWPLKDVRVSSRIGNSARLLGFPDGSQCETTDNDGVDRMLEELAPARRFSVHRLERSVAYAFIALVFTALAAWGIVAYGIPALARVAAEHMPPATEALMGRDTLRVLDEALLAPSALPPERQAELRSLLAELATRTVPQARLEFRKGEKLGANALALPAGTIVLTDELVKLAADDEEIAAVLAHEIGHLRHRHLLRLMLQNSAAAVFIALAVGDLSSLTSLAAALPTLLLQMKYSREFEFEADDFALEALATRGIDAGKFATILERIDARRGASARGPNYLSTHPDTHERVERVRKR